MCTNESLIELIGIIKIIPLNSGLPRRLKAPRNDGAILNVQYSHYRNILLLTISVIRAAISNASLPASPGTGDD